MSFSNPALAQMSTVQHAGKRPDSTEMSVLQYSDAFVTHSAFLHLLTYCIPNQIKTFVLPFGTCVLGIILINL